MTPPGSPRLARWLVRTLLPAGEREFVLGDLEELHAMRSRRDGRRSAGYRYWRDALASIMARLRRWRRHRPAPEGPLGSSGNVAVETLADLAAALRALRREPGFYAVAVLTLALGVGSTAAVFGMADQLLLRPLPGTTDPGGAAYLQFRSVAEPESSQSQGIAMLDFDEIRRGATLLEGMASYGRSSLHVSTGSGRPVAVTANLVYGDFFEVLGARAAAGRLLRADETALGSDPGRAVITPELSSTLFGAGANPVGRTVQVNEQSVTIIGVVAGGFQGPERGADIDMWLPHPALVPLLGFSEERLRSRHSVMHSDLVVRLRKDVEADAAEAQLAGLMARLAASEPDPESREWLDGLRPVILSGLHSPPQWRERTYGSLRLLAGVVGLVLLIACANVANLLLFRNVSRRGAVATRRALGASTGRVARQHLAESLVLAACGALLGLGAAWLIMLPFRGERLLRMPRFESFTLDGRALGFAVLISVVTAVLFGTVPAALAGRFDLGDALRDAGRGDTRRLAGIRWVMSAAQIALSLTLLVGGLLLARTIRNLYAVDSGFAIEGVAELYLYEPSWESGPALAAVQREVTAAVGALPEVEGVALDLYGPNGPVMLGRVALPDEPDGEATSAKMWPVTPGWFELLGVEMLSGRPFRPRDMEGGGTGKTVLTAALARRLFGSTDVVGRTVRAGPRELEDLEVVGVTGDLRSAFSPDEPDEAFFVGFDANPVPVMMTILIRTQRFDAGVARRIREAVESVLPAQPIPDPTPLSDAVRGIHSERRVFSRLLSLLSTLAVVLAGVGLYSVIAFTVAGRVREFGVRVALGASRERIARLVLRQAAAIVAAGIALGLLGAYLLSSVLESRLYGVGRLDPASYGAAVLLFTAVSALACWSPARTATRVDPVRALTAD